MRFTRQKNRSYVTINSLHLNDKSLSLKAKGFLSLIFSLPDDWDFSIEGMASICLESKGTIYRVIDELEEKGYCYKGQGRENNGFGKYEYTFLESSVFNENPQADNPSQYNANSNINLDKELIDGMKENSFILHNKKVQKQKLRKLRRVNKNITGEPSTISPDFWPPDDQMSKASALYTNIDVEHQTRQFKDHYLAKGAAYKNWIAKWRVWIRNSSEWAKEREPIKPPYPSSGTYKPGTLKDELNKLGLK